MENVFHGPTMFFRAQDEVTGATPAALAADDVVEVRKNLETFDGVEHIGRDGVMGADNGARFGRAAGADGLTFQEDHVFRALFGQIVGHTGAIQPPANDEDIGSFGTQVITHRGNGSTVAYYATLFPFVDLL
jgi:hypothetical protein